MNDWEVNETGTEQALREALDELGVRTDERWSQVDRWIFHKNSNDAVDAMCLFLDDLEGRN